MGDSLLDWMHRGGPFMWAILAASVVTVALILERGYVLWVRFRLGIEPFLDHVIDLLEEQKFSRALELCTAEQRHPFAQVAKAGIMKAAGSAREIERAMQAAALQAYPTIVRRTGYLSMLANVATLLGLLGTVTGLIDAFAGITEADVAAKQEVLAKGISVAMLTTAFGLLTAIPALIAAAAFGARQTRLLADVESRTTDLLNYLSERPRAGEQRAG